MTNDYSPEDFRAYHDDLIGQIRSQVQAMIDVVDRVGDLQDSEANSKDIGSCFDRLREIKRLVTVAYLDLSYRLRGFPPLYEERLARRVAKFRRRREREAKRSAGGEPVG